MSDLLKYEKIEGDAAKYLKKYFCSDFRRGYVKCKGFTLPEYFCEFGDSIRELEVRPDDVWVCSVPKTGTTWTQEMVWCIANNVNLDAAKELLMQRFPFLDHTPLSDYRIVMAKRPELEFPEYFLDSIGYIKRYPSPRFIKTHLPFTLLPQKLQQKETKTKIIYVTRNSRDTCVSYYHHCKLLEGYKGDFDEFCELFLSGAICSLPFWEHVLGYWKHKDNPNFLFITYEEMKKDLRNVIYRTAKFLDKSLSEEQVDKLMNHLSFENMKNNRAVNYEPLIELNQKNGIFDKDLNGSFIRCGKIGSWKEMMTPDMAERFEKWDQEHVKGIDINFLSNRNIIGPTK